MAHILVIDDDDALREVVTMALEQKGHRVTAAENGKVGVARFQTDPADVVLTDILMPEQEGVETIMQLRKRYPELKIIAMSGGGPRSAVYLQICARLGARTLAKPFSITDLDQAIAEVITPAS
jgi:DNA-binding NtrC family response regulator